MQNSRLISLKTKKLLNFKNSEREAAYHNFFFQNPRGAEPPPRITLGGRRLHFPPWLRLCPLMDKIPFLWPPQMYRHTSLCTTSWLQFCPRACRTCLQRFFEGEATVTKPTKLFFVRPPVMHPCYNSSIIYRKTFSCINPVPALYPSIISP